MSVITVVIRHILQAVPGRQSSQRRGCEIVLCQSSSGRNQSRHTLGSGTVDPLLETRHTHCTLEEGGREGGRVENRNGREEKNGEKERVERSKRGKILFLALRSCVKDPTLNSQKLSKTLCYASAQHESLGMKLIPN